MAVASWMPIEEALDPYLLTVMAQNLPPNDRGDQLIWDMFFPRQDVPSVDLYNVTALDYRPTADRREWNANGRLIPAPTPARRKVSIVPVEARDQIDEKEMQKLAEGVGGNAGTIREIIGVTVPARVKRMVEAVYRRIEVDAVKAWTTGTIIQRNPENAAQTYTASFGFSASRLLTAGTAWNDGGVNAYTLLQAWITAAEDLVGPIKGAMLRLATLNAILADAPNLPNSVSMTRTQLEDRISQDKGTSFQLYVNEQSVDIFDDGGTAYTRTKIWPAGYIAAIPTDERIGATAFAPVIRAMDLEGSANAPSGIDTNGITVFHDGYNSGKGLIIQAQANALPIPDEQRVYVTNTGVT
jgi:hypothetical protein